MELTSWENNGEANEQGEFIASINLGAGGVQRFIGKSHKEVADKLMMAQAESTKTIRTLTGHNTPTLQRSAEAAPAPMSDDARFKLARDLQDPATAPEAIASAVEATIGAPLQKIRAAITGNQEKAETDAVLKACADFQGQQPNFVGSPHNGNVMAQYLKLMNWDPTEVKNYHLAYEALTANGLLAAKPLTHQPAAAAHETGGLPATSEAPIVVTRPRGTISTTGLRAGDSSASAPARRAAPKYTIEDIERMPKDVYKQKLEGESGFRELVDALHAPAR